MDKTETKAKPTNRQLPMFVASLVLLCDVRVRTSDTDFQFFDPASGQVVTEKDSYPKAGWVTIPEGSTVHQVSYMKKGDAFLGIIETPAKAGGEPTRIPVALRTESFNHVKDGSTAAGAAEIRKAANDKEANRKTVSKSERDRIVAKAEADVLAKLKAEGKLKDA